MTAVNTLPCQTPRIDVKLMFRGSLCLIGDDRLQSNIINKQTAK